MSHLILKKQFGKKYIFLMDGNDMLGVWEEDSDTKKLNSIMPSVYPRSMVFSSKGGIVPYSLVSDYVKRMYKTQNL